MRQALLPSAALLCIAAAAAAQEPRLDINQQNKLRVAKLDRNSKDRTAQQLLKDYEAVKAPGMLIPPALLKKGIADGAAVLASCATIQKGFDEVKMPAEHAEAAATRKWAVDTAAALEPLVKDYEKRLPEMEKLADPKTYPEVEKDVLAVDEIGEDFRKGLRGSVEEVADRAARFPKVVAWYQEKFKLYRSFMVLNGGEKNPLYVKFSRTAAAVKALQAEAGKFVADAETGVPALLKEAEATAAKAAEEKRPAFFGGGVKQKTDEACRTAALCEALVGKEDPRALSLRKSCDEAQARIDRLSASLKEQILADARAPKEEYAGADKEEFRGKIQAEWKKAWPQDALLEVRFPKGWERKVEWRLSGDALQKVDMSYLYARAIVKTGDKVASVYVAVVNKDNLSGTVSYGVQTKKGIWVVEEVLLANLGK